MNSLQVNLENIHTNSQDLPYGFTTGELYQLLDQRSMVHESGLHCRVRGLRRWTRKVVCVFPMVVVSILHHAEFGPNDHREDASPILYKFAFPQTSHTCSNKHNLCYIGHSDIGCPRQRFLAINSGNTSDFLQAYYYAYYTQHIKNLEFIWHHSAIKFLHGRVLLNFLKWQFRKF